MADDIHTFGGLRADEIESRDKELAARIQQVERCVLPNGRPGLEERMREYVNGEIKDLRKYVDQRDDHKQANAMQAIGQVQLLLTNELQNQRTTAEERHKENTKKLDRNDASINSINVKIGTAIGIASAAQIILTHYWH